MRSDPPDASEPTAFVPLVDRAASALAHRLHVPIDHAAVIMQIRADSRGLSLERIADEILAPLAGRGSRGNAGQG